MDTGKCAVKWGVALVLALAGTAGIASAQDTLVHLDSIDLGDVFNGTTNNGNNPLSVAFDGTNAYVGGFNATGGTANVGVVKVENVVGPGAVNKVELAPTQFSSPNGRGLDSLAYDAGTDSIILHHDSGSGASSFISRHNAGTGANVWTVNNPQGARPLGAVGVDPVGDGGNPGVAYLVQGSGRRRLLSMTDGSTIFDGGNGGIILGEKGGSTDFGSAWRGVAFDSQGNIATSEQDYFGYGVRVNDNKWESLTATSDRLSKSIEKNAGANLVGQGIAILEGVGSDLLAVSGRNMTELTDLSGDTTAVSDTMVHIRNLDGSTTGLTQITLTGNENGIGSPWSGNVKNLAYGFDASSGLGTLLVLDFAGRRLDVYQVPEPASLALLAISGLWLLPRRRPVC